MVLDHTDEIVVVVNADTAVALGVLRGDFWSSILAAVVDDDVFVVPVGLPQDTLDAFLQECFTIIDRCKHGNQWFFTHTLSITSGNSAAS